MSGRLAAPGGPGAARRGRRLTAPGWRGAARRWRLATGLAVAAAIGAASLAGANGTTQREIQARVVRVDQAAQTLVVVHEFRGKRTEVVLRAAPTVRVFTCGGEDARLDRVKPGMTVTAFYEVAGADGVANLIVVEPAP